YSLGIPGLSEKRIAVRHGRVAPPGRAGRGVGARERPMIVTLPSSQEFQIRPQHYQRLTQRIAGKPEERILSYLMLRSLKQARYSEENVGHFALASPTYTHFTSPIRRYPDLIVHRILKAVLAREGGSVRVRTSAGRAGVQARRRGEAQRIKNYSFPSVAAGLKPRPSAGGALVEPPELHLLGLETSEAERRAADAERELMEWKKISFMAERLGEEFDALIISLTKHG